MVTKVAKTSETNNSLDSRDTVNLLYSAYPHRFSNEEKKDKESKNTTHFMSAKTYINGEITICMGSHPKRALNGLNGNNKPPIKTNDPQLGISREQATQIRRTVRVLHYLSPNTKLSFLTLTYGNDYPDDLTAKKHLDNFFKRIKRKRYKGKNFHYLWIAEKQKRGALHYHVVLIDYIKRDLIFDAWNGVVQKWQKKQGFEIQEVYPNIKGVRTNEGIQKYLTKGFKRIGGYLTKEDKKKDIQPIYGNIWNRSKLTLKACQCEKDVYESDCFEDVKERFEDLAHEYSIDETKEVYCHKIEDTKIQILLIKSKDNCYPMGKNNCTKKDVIEWVKQCERYSNLE